jgi:hypothetical protein
MRARGCWATLFLLFVIVRASAQKVQPEESAHHRGPHGLEGWTLNSSIPDRPNEKFPFTLMLSRKGKIIRQISGDPFVWNWIFWADGRQIAYESGPLHFSMQCILVDIATGRQLAKYDCWAPLPENAPNWAKALEINR